jgi:hypothetical protein
MPASPSQNSSGQIVNPTLVADVSKRYQASSTLQQSSFLPVFAHNIALPSPSIPGNLPQAQEGLSTPLPLFIPSPLITERLPLAQEHLPAVHPLELSYDPHAAVGQISHQAEDGRLLANTEHRPGSRPRVLEQEDRRLGYRDLTGDLRSGRPIQLDTPRHSFQADSHNRLYHGTPQQPSNESYPPAQCDRTTQHLHADSIMQGGDRSGIMNPSRWNEDRLPIHPSHFMSSIARDALQPSELPERSIDRIHHYSSLLQAPLPHQQASFDIGRTSDMARPNSSLSRLPQARSNQLRQFSGGGLSYQSQNSNHVLESKLSGSLRICHLLIRFQHPGRFAALPLPSRGLWPP